MKHSRKTFPMDTKPLSKWRFAIGTTSRVPNSGGGFHYMIADFDGEIPQAAMEYIDSNVEHAIAQKTPHGWHLYTDKIMRFPDLIETLHYIGADHAWLEIAEARGYLFLADKDKIKFPWPVEHMVLYYDKTTSACNPEESRLSIRETDHNERKL